jgi:hypothetical protein
MEEWARAAGVGCTDGYCDDPLHNMPWLNPETHNELLHGDGNEFGEPGKRPKIAALHSSSALAINVFDYWRHREKSAIGASLPRPAGARIKQLLFEQKFPTGISRPNIDVVVEWDGAGMLAIESKFTEWMGNSGRKALKDAYFPNTKELWKAAGLPDAQRAAEQYLQVGFDHLDVPQLLKHMLGLAHTCRERPWALLLLWHRINEEMAPAMENEISQFQQLLGKDCTRFVTMTYQELWQQLVAGIGSGHEQYVTYITARYFPRIGESR